MLTRKICLPEGYEWEDNGLMKLSKNSKKRIANAYPIIRKVLWAEDDAGNVEKCAHVGYCIAGQEREVEAVWVSYDYIQNGRFFKTFPIEVIIEPRCGNLVRELFQYSIREQLKEHPVEKVKKVEKPSYGWKGNRFYMGNPIILCETVSVENAYKSAGELLKILIHQKSGVIGVLVLAVMHGPLKKLLEAANVTHDFVTFVVGKTGTGKTDVTKKVCKIPGAGEYVFSAISDRKVIKQILANKSDMAIVLDDYCNSDSNRVTGKLSQTMAEIIQAACDAGKDVIDVSDADRRKSYVHIVVTGEKLFRNLSTVNRLFLVRMDEPLPGDLYETLTAFTTNEMSVFMEGLFSEIGKNWKEQVAKVQTDYKLFFKQAESECAEMDNSAKRIANTLAVQRTIWKILTDYFRSLGLDEKMISTADQRMQMRINACIRDLGEEIRKIKGEEDHKRYLPEIAQLVDDVGYKYSVADSEKNYLKHLGGQYKGLECIGACISSGYWSIKADHLSQILSKKMGEEVTKTKISAELRYFGLAYVDSEGKLSNKWLSKNRMYHINVHALRDLMDVKIPETPENMSYLIGRMLTDPFL